MQSIRLVGGVVAYNEERRIGSALASLLDQELPSDARWDAIWVVASGCTDRTEAVAEEFAQRFPFIKVLTEPERRGKASALRLIFREARGDYLVLLNADGRADPGAVRLLLSRAREEIPPLAVMGRPVPPHDSSSGIAAGVDLLWELHHRLHDEKLRTGRGTHLSDELLLLSLPELPPLPDGVINDGAFLGAWLYRSGGRLLYCPEARVTIEVPRGFADHVRQRRRILFGHRQVKELTGVAPTTLGQSALEGPSSTAKLLVAAVSQSPQGVRHFIWLAFAELAALAFAAWDRIPPRRDHRLWATVQDGEPASERRAPQVD